MTLKRRILVVDDQIVNRMLLCKILQDKYEVVEADNGQTALDVLYGEQGNFDAIMLDLVMPVLDGYAFIKIAKADPEVKDIPILITTQHEGAESEIMALEMGAADYITKPYHHAIILQRLINIIALRENAALRNTAERDALTGIYNKQTFYKKSAEMFQANPSIKYAILYCDVERFKIVNDFYGEAEGDKLLVFIGETLRAHGNQDIICARLSGDIFAVTLVYDESKISEYTDNVVESISVYPLNFKLAINFGIYIVDDVNIPVNIMCDRASLAIESIVGKYDTFFAYYDDSHRAILVQEQEIVNEMRTALAEGQFHVYIQPKFNMLDFSIEGGEALVRWIHPTKGFIGPDSFIPVFERNGFITELDYFVWETVCQSMRNWMDRGIAIVPLSINVSRVDIYHPGICDRISDLLKKYDIDPSLIILEITETSYTQDADELLSVVNELKKRGFSLSMDDFGSGYSSLNMLNEVPVDELKIDMRFLKSYNQDDEKSGNIINFIVSMAKWLDLQVIAEGVETIEQVNFLNSIGCSKGQGYFYSKPITIPEFEQKLIVCDKVVSQELKEAYTSTSFVDASEIWDLNSKFNSVFNSFVGALVLLEYKGNSIQTIRANELYYKDILPKGSIGFTGVLGHMSSIHKDDNILLQDVFAKILDTKTEEAVDIRLYEPETGSYVWRHFVLKVVHSANGTSVFLAFVEDISDAKEEEIKRVADKETVDMMLQSSDILMFTVDIREKKLISNKYGVEMFGFPEVLHDLPQSILDPKYVNEKFLSEAEAFWDKLLGGEPAGEVVLRLRKADGNEFFGKLAYKSILDENQKALTATCIITNADTEMELKTQHEADMKWRKILHDESYFIVEANLETGKIISKTGHGKLEDIDKTDFDEFIIELCESKIHPNDQERFKTQVRKELLIKQTQGSENKMINESRFLLDEERAYHWVTFSAGITTKNNIQTIILYCADIHEQKISYLLAQERDQREPLTGLFTELAFRDLVYFQQGKIPVDEGAALFRFDLESTDIHDVKCLSDSYVMMASILRQHFRTNDIIGCYGKNGFAVFANNLCSKEAMEEKGLSLCTALDAYHEEHKMQSYCDVIGVSIVVYDKLSMDELFKELDDALDKAKEGGVGSKGTCYIIDKVIEQKLYQ